MHSHALLFSLTCTSVNQNVIVTTQPRMTLKQRGAHSRVDVFEILNGNKTHTIWRYMYTLCELLC